MKVKQRNMSIIVVLTFALLLIDMVFSLGVVNTLSNFLVVFLFLCIALGIVGVKS